MNKVKIFLIFVWKFWTVTLKSYASVLWIFFSFIPRTRCQILLFSPSTSLVHLHFLICPTCPHIDPPKEDGLFRIFQKGRLILHFDILIFSFNFIENFNCFFQSYFSVIDSPVDVWRKFNRIKKSIRVIRLWYAYLYLISRPTLSLALISYISSNFLPFLFLSTYCRRTISIDIFSRYAATLAIIFIDFHTNMNNGSMYIILTGRRFINNKILVTFCRTSARNVYRNATCNFFCFVDTVYIFNRKNELQQRQHAAK